MGSDNNNAFLKSEFTGDVNYLERLNSLFQAFHNRLTEHDLVGAFKICEGLIVEILPRLRGNLLKESGNNIEGLSQDWSNLKAVFDREVLEKDVRVLLRLERYNKILKFREDLQTGYRFLINEQSDFDQFSFEDKLFRLFYLLSQTSHDMELQIKNQQTDDTLAIFRDH